MLVKPQIRTSRLRSPRPWSTSGSGAVWPTPWCARDRGRPRSPWPWPPTRRWRCTYAWTSGRRLSPPSGSAGPPGTPPLVVTTSGTAAAELHAAVVEAHLGGVPLIACTADRPPELRDVGAPQTIDQTHLFGRSVRWFCDPGLPDRGARAIVAVAGRSIRRRSQFRCRRPRSRPSQPAFPGAAPRGSGRRRRGEPGTTGGPARGIRWSTVGCRRPRALSRTSANPGVWIRPDAG